MTPLDNDLLNLSMQHVSAISRDITSLRDALWRSLQAEGWKPVMHPDRAYGAQASDSDRVLLRSFVQGNPDAFEILAHRHGGALLSFAQRSLSEADAQDAVQEAFLALFRKADDVLAKQDQNIRAFLFGATRIELLDSLRRRLRTERALEAYAHEASLEGPDPLEQALQQERTQLIRDLAATCNPLEQDVVLLALDGKTNMVIAQELGLEPGHVGVLKHRAHTKLRQVIAQRGER